MLGEVAGTDNKSGTVSVKVVLDSGPGGKQEETLPLHESTLLKAFNTGDHVQVVGGKFTGEYGMVVNTSGRW